MSFRHVHVAALFLLSIAIFSTRASGQTVEIVEQFLSLRQHSQARAAFVKLIADKTEEELRRFAYQPAFSRYPCFREVCAERVAELRQRDMLSLLALAYIKLNNGKPEAAELILQPVRDSADADVREDFHKMMAMKIEKAEAAEWKKLPEYKSLHIGRYRLLAGEYTAAQTNLNAFVRADKRAAQSNEVETSLLWCAGQLESDSVAAELTSSRTAHLAMATLLARRGKNTEAIQHVHAAIRASQRKDLPTCEPFFLEDFPTCNRLLQGDSPSEVAARAEYDTMLKLHQVTAAVIAFQKQHDVYPQASKNGMSWRQRVVPVSALPVSPKQIPEMFSVAGSKSQTPFVVVVGVNTVFSPDKLISPGRYIQDGTANTLLVLASHKTVEWNSTADLRVEDLSDWRKEIRDGFYAATCSGEVRWFPADYPEDQFKNFVNRRDRQRVLFPEDLKSTKR